VVADEGLLEARLSGVGYTISCSIMTAMAQYTALHTGSDMLAPGAVPCGRKAHHLYMLSASTSSERIRARRAMRSLL